MSWLTDLSIGRIFHYESPLTAEVFIKKLKSQTSSANWSEADDSSCIFVGKVKENRFRLRRKMLVRRAFTPLIIGKINIVGTGSSINARIVINPMIQFILSIWFVFFFGIAALFIYYSGMDEAVDLLMLFPLLFMFLILLLFLMMARSEIDNLHSDLDSLFSLQ